MISIPDNRNKSGTESEYEDIINDDLRDDNWKEEAETFVDTLIEEFTFEAMKANFNLPDLFANLILSTIPSYWDICSDVMLASTYFFYENAPGWAFFTLLFIFLPGLEWLTFHSQAKRKWRTPFLISCLFFPVFVLMFKLGLLVNHGPKSKTEAIYLSSCEAVMESTNQLILQVFIVFKNGWHSIPLLQIGVIVSSCVTICLGMTQEYLQLVQNTKHRRGKSEHRYDHLPTLEKAVMIAIHVPFYLFLTVFRVGSVSLVIAIIGFYVIPLYIFFYFILFFLGSFFTARKYSNLFSNICEYWKTDSDQGSGISLPFRSTITTVRSKYQTETVFQIFWYAVNMIMVFTIALLIKLKAKGFYTFFNLQDVKILEEKGAFDIAISTIVISGFLSLTIFFFQIWQDSEDKLFDTRISKEVTEECLARRARAVSNFPLCFQCKAHFYPENK